MARQWAWILGLALLGAGQARAAEHVIRFGSDHGTEAVTVDVGEVVRWDGDFLAHPLVSDADLHSTVRDGSTFALMFRRPGIYRYHCANHPDAGGTIRVGAALTRVWHTDCWHGRGCWDGCGDCCVW